MANCPFEHAWSILKAQTELGQHHPDFPSSQGPVLGYHGRNFSTKFNNPFGNFYDAKREVFDDDFESMQEAVANIKAAQLLQTGLVPTDTAESQVGSGRFNQNDDKGVHNYGMDTKFNPDIPASISVAVEPHTAIGYAEGARGYKDSSGLPGFYGIRAGAMQNALPLDEPLRRYKMGDTDDFIYNNQRYRYIPDGIAPNQMVRFADAQSMEEFDEGVTSPWYGRQRGRAPSRFIGVGPGQFRGRDLQLLEEGKMNVDEFRSPERDTQRVMESEQFIQDQIAQYQQQQLAQQQAMAQRQADQQAEQAFRQQQLATAPQHQLMVGVQ